MAQKNIKETDQRGLKFSHDYYPRYKSIPKKVEGRIYRGENSKGCVMGSSRALKDWLAEFLLSGSRIEFDGYTTTRQGRTGYGVYLIDGIKFYFGEKFVMNEGMTIVKRWNSQFWEDENEQTY